MARNSQSKIRRTKEKYGVDLSREIEIPKLEQFTTRKQFNDWKDKQRSFTNRHNLNYQYRKNQHGVVANKRQINEAVRDANLNIRKAKQIIKDAEKKPFISGGKVQGSQQQRMAQMGKPNAAGVNVPAPFKFDNINSKTRLNQRIADIKKRATPGFYKEKNKRMLNNYIELLEVSLNSDADELIALLRDVPPDDFYDMYLQFDEFDFNDYDSEGQVISSAEETQNNVYMMMDYVKKYYDGKLNFDMKQF